MNGPGIERRDRRMEEMGAAACTNRYAEPIFIASHRFHELCNSDDLYEISRPSLSLRIKEKASGIEEVDLSTFFFFFFFPSTMECSSKRNSPILSRWIEGNEKKFHSVIRRKKKQFFLASLATTLKAWYTRRRINTRFTISTSLPSLPNSPWAKGRKAIFRLKLGRKVARKVRLLKSPNGWGEGVLSALWFTSD